ncbi:MAG: GNAT family N-acetyltransferase [Rhodomicrobium sp.]|nr:GNAT family N-acetyltransferase [Rhodomicrobium sp.]
MSDYTTIDLETMTVRPGALSDAALLAEIEEIASTPPFEASPWQELADLTKTPLRDFLAAMFTVRAHAWGEAEDFIILEDRGTPLGACAVFEPEPDARDRRPLRVDAVPRVGKLLGWSADRSSSVIDAFESYWPLAYTDFLKPQAPAIIECVAVLPHARGRGLGKRLMREAALKAQRAGHDAIGISVIEGNITAQRLYEASEFEVVATFSAAYFEHRHPGVIKYRKRLHPSR